MRPSRQPQPRPQRTASSWRPDATSLRRAREQVSLHAEMASQHALDHAHAAFGGPRMLSPWQGAGTTLCAGVGGVMLGAATTPAGVTIALALMLGAWCYVLHPATRQVVDAALQPAVSRVTRWLG